MSLTRLSAVPILLFALAGRAQTLPATVDVAALVHDLDTPETHDQALARLKAIPESALAPLLTAAIDPDTPDSARTDIGNNIAAIVKRLRTARTARITAAETQWREKYAVAAYRTIGYGDPKWDDNAIAALRADNPVAALAPAKAAIDAGCKDPFLVATYALTALEQHRIEQVEAGAMLLPALQDLARSHYSEGTKFVIHMQIANDLIVFPGLVPIIHTSVLQEIVRAIIVFPQYVAQDPGIAALTRASADLHNDSDTFDNSKQAFDRINPLLTKNLPGSPIPLHDATLYYYDWARNGNNGAAPEPGENANSRAQRLDQAEALALQGWKLDPLFEKCPNDMLLIITYRRYDQDKMEKWYRLAMLANPDNRVACLYKLRYLNSQGLRQESRDFARTCIRIGTARNRIPTVMLDAINLLYGNGRDPALAADPDAWKDIQDVYAKLLDDKTRLEDDKPKYLADRAQYVKAAFDCQQWQAVLDLTKEFGDDVNKKSLGGKDLYAYYLKKAATQLVK